MIRDRLVCGVNDSRIQRSLLQEPRLTYEKALEMAQSIEAAAKDVQKLQPMPSVQTVHRSQKQFISSSQCYRCGGNHSSNSCRFRSVTCRACGKRGHIAKVCRSRPKGHQQLQTKGTPLHSVSKADSPPSELPPDHRTSLNTVSKDENPPPELLPQSRPSHGGADTYSLFTLNGHVQPMVVSVKINNQDVLMEVDTGASLSLVNKDTYELFSQRKMAELKPTEFKLHTYTGECLAVLGSVDVLVEYESKVAPLPLVVVEGKGPNLFGRNWMQSVRLNWRKINIIKDHQRKESLNAVLQKHGNVFQEQLGLLRGVPPGAKPRYYRPRTVSYFMRDKVDKELQRLEDEGVLKPVQFSDWAAPIVPVLKSDGHSIQICGDYKVIVNLEAKQLL